MTTIRTVCLLLLVALTTACASTQQAESVAREQQTGEIACDSFFVYTMCMTDRARDGDVDYVWFADDNQIFMYRPGETLPADMSIHRCARPIEGPVQGYGNALMYEDLSLLQEMDVKRKLLVEFMAAKDEVDDCYGGDSMEANKSQPAEDEFAADDFDWGED